MSASSIVPRCSSSDSYDCYKQPEATGRCLNHTKLERQGKYRRCSFLSKKGSQCCNVAVRVTGSDGDPHGLCPQHIRQTLRLRREATASKKKDPSAILKQITEWEKDRAETGGESVQPGASWFDMYSDASDNDEIDIDIKRSVLPCPRVAADFDSVLDDPLKNAGVLTIDEVLMVSRDKMAALLQFYMDEFSYLETDMRKKYKAYLVAAKEENKHFDFVEPRTLAGKKRYKQMCALRRYHKRMGLDAYLRKKSGTKQSGDQEKVGAVCSVDDCEKEPLPFTLFCNCHIAKDTKQYLFERCTAGGCSEPVVPFGGSSTCFLHQTFDSATAVNWFQKHVLGEEAGSSHDIAMEQAGLPTSLTEEELLVLTQREKTPDEGPSPLEEDVVQQAIDSLTELGKLTNSPEIPMETGGPEMTGNRDEARKPAEKPESANAGSASVTEVANARCTVEPIKIKLTIPKFRLTEDTMDSDDGNLEIAESDDSPMEDEEENGRESDGEEEEAEAQSPTAATDLEQQVLTDVPSASTDLFTDKMDLTELDRKYSISPESMLQPSPQLPDFILEDEIPAEDLDEKSDIIGDQESGSNQGETENNDVFHASYDIIVPSLASDIENSGLSVEDYNDRVDGSIDLSVSADVEEVLLSVLDSVV